MNCNDVTDMPHSAFDAVMLEPPCDLTPTQIHCLYPRPCVSHREPTTIDMDNGSRCAPYRYKGLKPQTAGAGFGRAGQGSGKVQGLWDD